MNLAVVFLTGLTTGGISCMAVQGGLLAGLISNQNSKPDTDKSSKSRPSLKAAKDLKNPVSETTTKTEYITGVTQPIIFFLISKLVAHILLGFLLGWIGSALTLTLTARLVFQSLAALFMFATAANLLQLHPIFRYIAFQPPKFLQRFVRSTSRSEALFAPVVLGAATIFIPCGVTQAMEVLAISTGNPFQGAAIMGAFTLGTMPIFAGIGYLAQTLKNVWQDRFSKIAATALLLMAVWSFNGVLLVLNSPITLQRITYPVAYFFSEERFKQPPVLKDRQVQGAVFEMGGAQIAKILVTNHGYAPNHLTVNAGKPVELTLESKETYSCALSFIMKEFGIAVDLNPTDSKKISFTPTKKGSYTFSCSMGMYSGTVEVI